MVLTKREVALTLSRIIRRIRVIPALPLTSMTEEGNNIPDTSRCLDQCFLHGDYEVYKAKVPESRP